MSDNITHYTIAELERDILELEEVRVIIRASGCGIVIRYPYERCYPNNGLVGEFISKRITSIPSLQYTEVVLLDGHCNIVHPRTKMGTLRKTYER
jgi:hypothetical protein